MKTITQQTKKVFFTLMFILITMIGYSQTTVAFLRSGNGLPANSWTCPANVTSIQVQAYGAGGGGGRGGTSNRQGGGGGGGGAYNSASSVAVTPGNTYVITVGTGGAGGTPATQNGNNASTTTSATFNFVTVSANGGSGGRSYSNGFAGGISGGVALTGTGGNGSNGSGSGGGGGCAGTTGNGGNGNIASGGTSGGGNAGVGGNGTTNNGSNGSNGNNYGAGGGGGTRNSNGGNGANGYLTITIPGPTNNDCSGSTSLTVNPTTTCTTSTTGTTMYASQSQAGCTGTADDDVWYQFTATSTTHIVTVTPGSLSDAVFQVFSGSCGGLTSVVCTDVTGGSSVETSTLTGLTVGFTYFVRVYSFANGSGQGTFDICITTPIPEINIQGNATTIVDGNATPSTGDFTDFGSTIVGVGFTRTFTIQNTGTASMTIGAISFSGTNPSDFTITTAPSATIAAGGSTTFVVTFNPSAAGTRTATISIVNNDSDENPYDFALQGIGIARPANDECNTAISLTAPTSCTFTTYTNINASDSASIPAPGCAGYLGADVWFSVIVPASGVIEVDMQIGSMTDSGLALYTGTCGSLTLLSCDDDASTNGNMSYIRQTGLTAGQTIFIRVWSFNNSNNGTFGICVRTDSPVANDDCTGAIDITINPTVICTVNTTGTTVAASQSSVGCSGSADDDVWYSFTATDLGHTITVRPSTLVNAVFQVYSGSCGTLTSLACINATIGASIETTTVSGLTIGNVYYVRVYSNASGSGQGAFTICITSPCALGSGTSTKACASVVAGGLGLNGADPAPIDSCTASTCTNLEANYLQLGNTTSYTVQSIPYVPPYQFTCLRNSVSVDIDDVWSQPVSMPFNFCFYGTNYNNFLISSNGAITFDTVSNIAGGYSAWPISTNVPDATMFLNSIFGVYHDIDPSINGEIGWELITLATGCRAMVISWGDVPMYLTSCNSIPYTGMIVLYENTNIIEVYIKEKRVCSAWNSGNAVVGVQNATGTIGTVAPNRNSLDPDWTTTNEAWRFLPSGPSITTITWYEGSGTSGPIVGSTATINVCPTTTTTYTAKVEYALCNGGTLTLTDPTTVTITTSGTPVITSTTPGSRVGAGTVVLGATASLGTISWYANASGGSALGTGASFTTPVIALSTTYYVESVNGTCISPRVAVLATVTYPDTDIDGLPDNIDLDDDNDGIPDTFEALVDTDTDGIQNSLDLDSDNDGIADIIEENWNSLSNGKDTMDLITIGVWIDTNTNGWHDTAEAYYATNLAANFDGDIMPNYIDLDSDNDACFDVDEAGLLNGDGDITGDGKGDGADTDSDGILNFFDTYVGFGNTGKTLPINTLGTGNPDYQKISALTVGVFDISNTLYSNLDTNNDGKIDDLIDTDNDADRDGILDFFDTNIAYFGSPRDLNRKLFLDFDGRNDYGQATAVLGGLANASMMAWINLKSGYNTTGVVVGQNRFQIRVTSAKRLDVTVNSTTLSYGVSLSETRWYHVAATYNGTTLKLFLNGVEVNSVATSGNIGADASPLTIGKNPSSSTNYFTGKIDEVRIFNVALTNQQLQRMVYQEIQNTASQVRGAIVPKDIEALPFANVLRYYRMDVYKDDIIDDLTTPAVDLGTGMKIFNHKNIKVQQAPMPFVTQQAGDFATAVNSVTNEIYGMDIMNNDYSIVQVKHNISESFNITNLGMFVDPSVTITINNDNKIQNDWYLKLDGKIDLQGRSQLVQTVNSELDVTSAGYIERDQQGQSNKFNYNYWSSPVGTLSTSSNNNSYTVNGVMKDGTIPTSIQNINWIGGYNGAATSPISVSNYWIFKFQNVTPVYANWSSVGPNGTLLAAQGYTMKGTDALTSTQNYTFVGKPNNGTISTPIAGGNLNLSGNPYASAIDCDTFITDNNTSITGTLYFWEHFSTNTSHNLLEYQGGYATRNLVGGTPPVSPAGISGLGSSTRTPKRFIPVGQGFFVTGSATGGNIIFNNSQRLFIKENNASSNVLFRHDISGPISSNPMNNNEDSFVENTFAKIRLGFNSATNYHRQILIGFMNENATSAIDPGYDAVNIDNQPNDMYFMNSNNKLIIQGEGFFNTDNIYPIGIKSGAVGNVNFTLDEIENFDASQDIFIYDNQTNLYHNIRNQAFEIELPIGTVLDRFSLRFKDATPLATTDFNLSSQIIVAFTSNDNTINIRNNALNTTIKKVELYNILGQSIRQWDVKDYDQAKIKIPVKNISTGTYIVKILTSNGDISKKIIIN